MHDELQDAIAEIAKELEKVCEAWEQTCKKLCELASETQEAIDRRKEERECWGYPPTKLIVAYKEPIKRIRPCARSFGKRR